MLARSEWISTGPHALERPTNDLEGSARHLIVRLLVRTKHRALVRSAESSLDSLRKLYEPRRDRIEID